MSNDDFEPFEPAPEPTPEPAPITRPARKRPAPPAAPTLPTAYLLGCCLIDEGHTLDKAIAAGLTSTDFTDPSEATIFACLRRMRHAGTPIATDTLVEALGAQLAGIGLPTILALDQVGTTARAGWAIEQIADASERRRVHAVAAQIAELTDLTLLPDLLQRLQSRTRKSGPIARPLSSFSIPPKNDPSVLLGNRYLNRGDGLILSGPSGMGKSSISLQAAACWAIGRPFMGIPPNGQLRILIVQSEDSDGDIAEVWASIVHCLAPSADELALLDKNIRIVTDRVNRGTRFVSSLRAHVAEFKPDIAILNPLQAFIDGDVTESKDIGAFLREGLNGLNEPPTFGYLIVHHTTKPATGKDRSERLWHEVMYDMAGGAEIINWARGIISLRPTATEGTFRLILAKRGRRAGVTREVEQGAGTRMEPVTTIGMRHSTGKLPSGTPIIFWEPCALTDDAPKKESTGRPSKYKFSDYRNLFPPASGKGMALNELERALSPNGPISRKSLHDVVVRWMENDEPIEIIDVQGQPRRYRLTV